MARRATLTLKDLTVGSERPTRGSGPAEETARGRAAAAARERRGQTLRLEPEAWRQLKMLALDQGKTSHDLLIEAVNLLFDHYNRPTIAG